MPAESPIRPHHQPVPRGWVAIAGVASGVVLLALLGTSATAQPLAPPAPEQVVVRCLGHLQRGEIDAARAMFAEGTLPEGNDQVLQQAQQALRIGTTLSAEFLDRSPPTATERGAMDTLVFHVKGKDRGLMVIAQTLTGPEGVMMAGLGLEPAPLDLADRFPLTWDVSYVHYYVLIAFVAVPLLMLYAVVKCIRGHRGAELLWLPFILVGVGKVSAVWVSGPPQQAWFDASLIVFQLFGVGASKVPIWEPWVFTVSFPLGAVCYLIFRRIRDERAQTHREGVVA